jgi:hypothetical protein
MKFVLSFFFSFFLLCQSGFAADYVSGKHIWIWQEQQLGEAVEDGELIYTFRIISGLPNSQFRTREGDFSISWKKVYYTNHDGVDMPYAMFFDGMRALHGWSWTEPFPSKEEAPWFASHGCVSNNRPKDLYDWAQIGTEVHVRGERTGYN